MYGVSRATKKRARKEFFQILHKYLSFVEDHLRSHFRLKIESRKQNANKNKSSLCVLITFDLSNGMSSAGIIPVWTKASQMALSDSMTIELTVPSVIWVQESRRPRRGTIGSYCTDCRRKLRQRKISSVVDSRRNPRAIRISSVVLWRLIWLLAANLKRLWGIFKHDF